MTQITFTVAENAVPYPKMNQAVQGYRFLRRTTFTGLPEPVFHLMHGRASALFAMGIGPGGGGAGAVGSASFAVGGGGGAGGYCFTIVTSLAIVRSTLKIDAPIGGPGGLAGAPGGADGLGALVSYVTSGGVETFILIASAGGGGGISNVSTAVGFGTGGTAGTAQAGLINMSGEDGGAGIRFGGDIGIGGRGGASRFRGYGRLPVGGAGHDATSYGAGGSGAASIPPASGGAGGPALVVLDEYY